MTKEGLDDQNDDNDIDESQDILEDVDNENIDDAVDRFSSEHRNSERFEKFTNIVQVY